MYELVLLGGGILIGLTAGSLPRRWSTIAYISVLAVVIGLTAAYFSTGLEHSWAYAVFDIGQVVVAAIAATSLATLLSTRVSSRRAPSSIGAQLARLTANQQGRRA